MQIWLILIASFIQNSGTEKLEYDIYYKNRDIGDYVLERSRSGDLVKYHSHSVTNVHIMGTISVTVTQEVHFKNGVLIWCEARTKVNGHLHDHVVLKKIGHQYQLEVDGDTKIIGDEIRYSTVRMMFEEPVAFGRVFSEVEGEFHRIEKTGDKAYVKTNSKGRKNYYTFDQKGMKHADVDSGFYDFEMKRRN